MWKPTKLNIETEKKHILDIAEKEINKKLAVIEKKISKKSEELREMDIFKTTPLRRRSKRLALDADCEERDSYERKLDIIKNWVLSNES